MIEKNNTKIYSDYEIILTSDFNMEFGDKNFDSFVKDVNDKIKHVDIAGNTWHGNNGEESAVDHIFIPKNWQIEKAGIINSNETSDHDVLFAEVIKKINFSLTYCAFLLHNIIVMIK